MKKESTQSTPLQATDVPPREQTTFYPEPFASLVAGRQKRKLGDHFGLTNFGINMTRLAPGAASSIPHHHSRQDEFLYILEGTPTLRWGDAEYLLQPGACVGFQAGEGRPHQLLNKSEAWVVYLEVGDRTPGDEVTYPDHDLAASSAPEGGWRFTRKDGTPYQDDDES